MFATTNRIRIGNIGGHEIAIDPIALGIFALYAISEGDMAAGVAFFVAAFLSILVHELGHAFAIRGLTGEDAVVIIGLGGVTFPRSSDPRSVDSVLGRRRVRTPGQQLWISLAGPGAGFLLGLAGWGAAVAAGATYWGDLPWQLYWEGSIWLLALLQLIWVSFVWGVVNLVPAYPLDGGQAFRAILRLFGVSPPVAGRVSRRLGMVIAAAAGVWALVVAESILLVFICGWIFMMNVEEARREGF